MSYVSYAIPHCGWLHMTDGENMFERNSEASRLKYPWKTIVHRHDSLREQAFYREYSKRYSYLSWPVTCFQMEWCAQRSPIRTNKRRVIFSGGKYATLNVKCHPFWFGVLRFKTTREPFLVLSLKFWELFEFAWIFHRAENFFASQFCVELTKYM